MKALCPASGTGSAMDIAGEIAAAVEAARVPESTATLVMAVRLGFAALMGGVLGLEREIRGRSAGLKTHMLTAVAAATFALVTAELFTSASGNPGANADPIRIIEAVTAGVAFIAAGAIISSRDRVIGLTTGAGIWMAGAIGVACGAGYLLLAGIATGIAFLILTVVRWVERKWL